MDRVKRIIDVNLNRFNEGMRVLEELLRFYFEDVKLTASAKNFRHRFSHFVKRSFSATELYISRDIAEDVGKEISTDQEEIRSGLEAIFYSNAGRVKESIRVVEEFLKLFDPGLAKEVEQLRYEFYQLEKEAAELFNKRTRVFYSKKIYPVFSPKCFDKDFKRVCDILRASRIAVVQLRMKGVSTKEYTDSAKYMRIALSESLIIINDRVDVALASGANGVHIGDSDMDYKTVRSLSGGSLLIGVSAVNGKKFSEYATLSPDYIGVGPVFKTTSKSDASAPLGEKAALKIASAHPDVFKVAIGGINTDRAKKLIEGGFDMTAVVSDIFEGDIEKNLQRYVDRFGDEGVLI